MKDLFGEERKCLRLADLTQAKRTSNEEAGDDYLRMFEVLPFLAVFLLIFFTM